MRRILTIALFFIAGQVAAQKYAMSPGEYTQGFIDSANKIGYTLTTDNTIAGTGNFGGQGIAYPVVTGYSNKQMKLVCTGLHDGGFVSLDSGHAFMYGLASNCQLGNGLTTGPSTCYEILTDALGNPFYNINGMTAGWGPVDAVPFYAATKTGGGDTVWVWGNGTPLGMGSCLKPTATIVATGKTVTQIVANNSFIHAVCSDGTVYVIGGQDDYAANSGTNSNPTTWTQVTGLPSIAYVVKGNSFVFAVPTTGTDLWGWGEYGWIVENQSTVSYMPITSPTKVTSYFPSGIFPIAQMVAAHTGYAILNTTTNSLFTGGSNEVGLCGTGPTIIWPLYTTGGSTPYNGGTAAPWNWNTGMGQYLNQCTQICKGANVKWGYIYGGPLYSFYFYFEATNGSLVTEGRAKDVLGDGVIFADSAGSRIAAAFAMGHNITYPSLLPDLLSVTTATVASCPGCVDGESPISGTTPCTYGTDGPSRPNTNLRCNLVVTPTPGGYNWSIATSTTDGSHKIMWDHSVLISTGGTPVNTGIPGGESGSVTGIAAGTYSVTDTMVDNAFDTVYDSQTFTVNTAVQTHWYFNTATGSDANSCSLSQPCLSNFKFNSLSLTGGDTVSFEDGQTFLGNWVISSSGSPGLLIVINSYGIGNEPIIGGLYTLGSFTNVSGNLYQTPFSGTFPTLFLQNGGIMTISQTPNISTGYFIFQPASSTTTDIHDPTNATRAYIGGKVRVRSSAYTIDSSIVTSVSSTDVGISPAVAYNNVGGNGWKLWMNIPDTIGEVRDSGGNVQVYNIGSPSGIYQVPNTGTPLTVSGSYILVTGLNITGSDSTNIYLSGSNDKFLSDSITNGMDAIQTNSATSDTIQNCYIAHMEDNGVLKRNSANYNNVYLNNTWYDIGMHLGQGTSGNNYQTYCGGIFGDSANIVKFNTFDSIGYIPLAFYGSGAIIDSNFIRKFGYTKIDGGGIYTWIGSQTHFPTQRQIIGNTVDTAGGPMSANGTIYTAPIPIYGIYLDNWSSSTLVQFNGVFNMPYSGIFDHGDSNTIVYNNAANNGFSDIYLSEIGPVITGIIVEYNSFGSGTPSSAAVRIGTIHDDLPTLGVIDNNQVGGSPNTTSPYWTFSSGGGDPGTFRTPSNWTSNMGYDTHSTFQTGLIVYFYNQTSSSTNTTIPGIDADLLGNRYYESIPLLPYSSIVGKKLYYNYMYQIKNGRAIIKTN